MTGCQESVLLLGVSSCWARCRKRGEISGNVLAMLSVSWVDAGPDEVPAGGGPELALLPASDYSVRLLLTHTLRAPKVFGMG